MLAYSTFLTPNSKTETNTESVINNGCSRCWLYPEPPAPLTGATRCAGHTKCLFRRTAVNLIRPQTLMTDSPVEHNGLSNAMKSAPLPPARSPCIRLNGSEATRSARTDVIALVEQSWLANESLALEKSSRHQRRVTLGMDTSPAAFHPS